VYASAYTPEFNGYAFAYGFEEYRLTSDGKGTNPIPADVDIVMTHGPPRIPPSFQMPGSAGYKLDTNSRGDHIGCSHLWQAIQGAKPFLHCFGHIHEGYGAQDLAWSEKN